MVNQYGQMYTIEGVAAAVLMLVTVYLVISSTNLFTPGDSHITDMQLEQIGNDALTMMDTPATHGGESDLSQYISGDEMDAFKTAFLNYVNKNTLGPNQDNLKCYGTVYYYDPLVDEKVQQYNFGGDEKDYYHENAVTVRRWVYLYNDPENFPDPLPKRPQMVLLEVVLWRE